MVVPVDRISSIEKTKKFIGNKLSVSVKCNSKTLVILGNFCKIEVEENLGNLRVMGDSCKVTVLSGSGSIEYVGNFGKITLGESIPVHCTTLMGNNIKICTKNGDLIKLEKPEKTVKCPQKTTSISIKNSSEVHLSLKNLPGFINGIKATATKNQTN